MRDVVYYTSLYDEEHEAEHRLDKGFSRTLIPHLTQGLQILRNWKVEEINDTQQSGVIVKSLTGQDLRCHRVVITPTHQIIAEMKFSPPLEKQFAHPTDLCR